MVADKRKRVLVTGGGTFLGINIASALLAEGADVTLLIRPDTEARLGPLATRVRWFVADVWDVASLKGRARGQGTVIHTVGSMVADPARGLTYQRLNVVSARNAANMCVSDGVAHLVFISAVGAPWVSRQYVKAKREAETYVQRVGLQASVVRAPLTYVRGAKRPLFYRLVTAIGRTPPLSWMGLANLAPMPLDILARGVARIALNPPPQSRLYAASDLRRLNSRDERRGRAAQLQTFENPPEQAQPFAALDDETPFGWTPPVSTREDEG